MLRNQFNPLYSTATVEPPANTGGAPEKQPETQTGDKTSEQDADEEESEPEPEKAPDAETESAPSAAITPPKLNAFQRGALRALGTGDLIARVEQAEGARAVAEAQLATANTTIATLQAEVKTLKAEAAKTPEKIAAAEKVREGQVSKGVQNELVKLGVDAAEAPSQVAANATPEAMLEHFQTLKGADRTAYYREHKAQLKEAEASAAKSSK